MAKRFIAVVKPLSLRRGGQATPLYRARRVHRLLPYLHYRQSRQADMVVLQSLPVA